MNIDKELIENINNNCKNKRDYKYDNIKCFLIFCVVFAHLLEILNGSLSNKIYILIYTFHMPVFVYISGYFSKGSSKNIAKFIYIYLIWQTIFYLFDVLILKANTRYNLFLPNWTLWYIFALIFWNLIIKCLNKLLAKHYIYIIMISIVLSLSIGFFYEIGYKFSASRIITFFPYFLLGYISKNVEKKDLKIYRYKNWIIGILAIISILYFGENINIVKPLWLYGSYSYERGRIYYNF